MTRRVLEIVLIAAVALVATAPLPRPAVERVYSRMIYPAIQPRLTGLSNMTAFSWLDALVVAAITVVVAIWGIAFTRPQPWSARRLLDVSLHTLAIAAVLYSWFLVAWGLNYRRQPLRTVVDFREDRITESALVELGLRDADELNTMFDAAHQAAWGDFRSAALALDAAFAQTQRDLGMSWHATPARPKRSMLDLYFRRVSVDGMTDPFFLETLANQSLLPFERPFVIAHEWAHLAGYADESEANFLAWLTCMRSGPQQKYSAWLSLHGTIIAALPQADRRRVLERLEAGPRRDLKAMAERIATEVNPRASRAGYAVYDRFLKANRVPSGIRNYNEVIRLMLGTEFDASGNPVLRTRF
jgi:hypothetical protein